MSYRRIASRTGWGGAMEGELKRRLHGKVTTKHLPPVHALTFSAASTYFCLLSSSLRGWRMP